MVLPSSFQAPSRATRTKNLRHILQVPGHKRRRFESPGGQEGNLFPSSHLLGTHPPTGHETTIRSVGSALKPEDPDGQIIEGLLGERLAHTSTEDSFDLLRKTLKAHDPTPRTGRPASSPVMTPSRTVTTPFTTTMLMPVGYWWGSVKVASSRTADGSNATRSA